LIAALGRVDQTYSVVACPTAPIHYHFDPVQTIKTTVLGAINTLGLIGMGSCHDEGKRQAIDVSTICASR
jgi:hypothetical protein